MRLGSMQLNGIWIHKGSEQHDRKPLFMNAYDFRSLWNFLIRSRYFRNASSLEFASPQEKNTIIAEHYCVHCMYVCTYVRTYVCMYVCMYGSSYKHHRFVHLPHPTDNHYNDYRIFEEGLAHLGLSVLTLGRSGICLQQSGSLRPGRCICVVY